MGLKHIFAALFSILLILGCGVSGRGHKAGDGIIIQPPTTSTAAINTLITAASTVVTYAPGKTAAQGVYASWDALYADVGGLTGYLEVVFDDSTSPIVLLNKVAPFAAARVKFTAARAFAPDFGFSTISCTGTTTFGGSVKALENVVLSADGSAAPISYSSGSGLQVLEMKGAAALTSTGSKPAVEYAGVTDDVLLIYAFDQSSVFSASGSAPSVRVTGAATILDIEIKGTGTIEANSIGAPTQAQVAINLSSDGSLSSAQSGILDTPTAPTPTPLGRSTSVGYTPTTAGDWPTAPTTVQGGLDTLAASSHAAGTYAVRGVVDTNVATLATFTVAGRDGLTYSAGQIPLLVKQTTKSQNGPWVVGAVTTPDGGVAGAPLTRPSWWAGAMAAGVTFTPNEGDHWRSRAWRVTTAGAVTVDSTSIDLYPQTDYAYAFLDGNAGGGAAVVSLWKLANSLHAGFGLSATTLTASGPGEGVSIKVNAEGPAGTSVISAFGPALSTSLVFVNATNF